MADKRVKALTTRTQIRTPQLVLKPPSWILGLMVIVLVTLIVAIAAAPDTLGVVKWIAIPVIALVSLGVIRNILRTAWLATVIVNTDGVFFLSGSGPDYVQVTWDKIGEIKPCVFGLNKKGICFEVLDDDANDLERLVGNVISDSEGTFVSTLSQLQNRRKFVERAERFRKNLGGKG